MNILFPLLILMILIISDYAFAFDDGSTHPNIADSSIRNSTIDAYLKNSLNLREGKNTYFGNKTATDLLKYGAELKDDPPYRASNHFHNPLTDKDATGLTDTSWPVDLWCYGFGLDQYPPNQISSNITWATGYFLSETIVKRSCSLQIERMGLGQCKGIFS